MTYGMVVDPVSRGVRDVHVDLNDFRAIQRAIGGHMYEAHAAQIGQRVVGTIFMVENRQVLPSQHSFAFEALDIAGRSKLRIYGPALFVPHDQEKEDIDASHVFFPAEDAQEADQAVILTMNNWELKRFMESEIAAAEGGMTFSNADLIPSRPSRTNGTSNGELFSQLAEHPRGFMPRPIGTFRSARCSVAELEGAFLGLYEWARKDTAFRHSSSLGRSFSAPPFFFPDGLEPSEQEFEAALNVEVGTLALPFPMPAFWIVRWDVWLGGDGGGEGPALLYVEQEQSGFTTRDIFFDRRKGYSVCDPERHDRLSRTPAALVCALHRIESRRHLVERQLRTPELDRVNAGRAKSKHGLPPLPPFTRITGHVEVGRSRNGQGIGSERCRHERRGHWRKRRNGVELPPEAWVRVRHTTIRPDMPVAYPRRYLVV